jgi:multidrug efflux pump subunit AcrB
MINVKAISGLKLQDTQAEIAKLEGLIRREVPVHDLKLIVSNIGSTPGFSSLYTPNSATHTAFVQVALNADHTLGSYEYMARVREAVAKEMPEISAYFQSGGLVDAVLNLGLPAPIDVKISGSNLKDDYSVARQVAAQARKLPNVSDILIPQDIDAPALMLNIDRVRASELDLSQKEVVDNVISALTSNAMIAPSYWVDPKTGNDYMLTVQYPEGTVKSLTDLKSIPLRGKGTTDSTRLDMVADVSRFAAPTEVDHYQLQRCIDVYIATKTEAIGGVADDVRGIIKHLQKPENVRISLKGSVQAMSASLSSFGLGLLLSVLLVYLVLVAQFRSFIDPFLILLAVPPGLMGVLVALAVTGTTLNIMSLMGIVMMVGIVVSNSILIVEFTHRLMENGMSVIDAVAEACRVRLRPILMTSFATVFGMLPMALKLGTGSESYAPLARAIIGGLFVSVVLTVFLVPAAFLLVYRNRDRNHPVQGAPEAQSEAAAELTPERAT